MLTVLLAKIKLEGLQVTVSNESNEPGQVNSVKRLIIYKKLNSHIVQISFGAGSEPM